MCFFVLMNGQRIIPDKRVSHIGWNLALVQEQIKVKGMVNKKLSVHNPCVPSNMSPTGDSNGNSLNTAEGDTQLSKFRFYIDEITQVFFCLLYTSNKGENS